MKEIETIQFVARHFYPEVSAWLSSKIEIEKKELCKHWKPSGIYG